MTDRHIKKWNMEEPIAPKFEDGCGCVSDVTQRLVPLNLGSCSAPRSPQPPHGSREPSSAEPREA